MNANDTMVPETVSIQSFKDMAPKFGPGGITRLATITVIDKSEIVYSDDGKAGPKYDGTNEVLGGTNFGKGYVLIGRQRSKDDDGMLEVRYEAVSATIPYVGQTMACSAIVDETLEGDVVYELYSDDGEAVEIQGLKNTELVDQKLRIQAFIFDTGDQTSVFAGNFREAVKGFKADKYLDGLKFIVSAPKGTKLVRMDGKVALKLPNGEFQAYNLDGTRDMAYDGLPKIPDATMVLQTIDENGAFVQGWTVAKYYGDEDIVSYHANVDTEADTGLRMFLRAFQNTPLGQAMQKMHAAPEAYRAK